MTIAVDLGRKATKTNKQTHSHLVACQIHVQTVHELHDLNMYKQLCAQIYIEECVLTHSNGMYENPCYAGMGLKGPRELQCMKKHVTFTSVFNI